MNCFKAYDIRGKVPEELNETMAYQIGNAYVKLFKAKKIVVGYDIRLESPMLAAALIKGLSEAGADIIDIGLCGTEEVYFHTFNLEDEGVDGGIMITASHNPKGYNGMKMVRKGCIPIANDTGLLEIKEYIKKHPLSYYPSSQKVSETSMLIKENYIKHLLSYIDPQKISPLKIVVNPGNSAAGIIIKLLAQHLPCEFIYINEQPDGNFPNGVPNPMLVENQRVTAEAVIKHKADLGIAWDGDFDRCFFFDEQGNFIEGYYIVGLLAQAFLQKYKGATIIHDPRLLWNTIDIIKNAEGIAVQSKAGHAFIKAKMRLANAIYGGEMSAHHYFKNFAYCDSGMIPWLLIIELLSAKATSLSQLVAQRIKAFPCSGEINYVIPNPDIAITNITEFYSPENPIIDYTDGISLEFTDWRFNLRKSNTEPLVRLNVETRGDTDLLKAKVKEIEQKLLKQV